MRRERPMVDDHPRIRRNSETLREPRNLRWIKIRLERSPSSFADNANHVIAYPELLDERFACVLRDGDYMRRLPDREPQFELPRKLLRAVAENKLRIAPRNRVVNGN